MPPFLILGGIALFLALRGKSLPLSKAIGPQQTTPALTPEQQAILAQDKTQQVVTLGIDGVLLGDGLTGDAGSTGLKPSTTGNDIANAIDTGASDESKGGGFIAAVGGAIIQGVTLGKEADKAILGADSTPLTQGTAEIGGGILLAATSILYLGWISPVVFVVVAAVVLIVYAVVAIINDIEALSYGQSGATRDFYKVMDQLHADCFHKLRIQPQYASVSDKEIERALIPFVDGYCRELNYVSFMEWMRAPKGITQLGLDTQGKAQHGADRGHFVGVPVNGLLTFDEKTLLRSYADNFASLYCPINEQTFEIVPIPPPKVSSSNITSSRPGLPNKVAV